MKIALVQDFDLIILDLMLPSLEGIPICKRLREKKPGQGIIMLTAKAGEDDMVKGFQAGAVMHSRPPATLGVHYETNK